MESLWRPLKRARASISGPVQTSDKENAALAATAPHNSGRPGFAAGGSGPDRRKRAQSLGGPLHTQLNQEEEDLSPRKKARRSLVPGRSILKASAGPVNPFGPFFAPSQDDNQTATATLTLTQSTEPTSSQEVTSSSQQSEDRRKSLARRVSFCNRVTMREFEKDQPQPGDSSRTDSSPDREPAQPNDALSSSIIVHAEQPNNGSPLKGQRYSDLFEQSMDMAGDDVTGAFGGFVDASNLADEAPMTFVEDSSEPEEGHDNDEQDMSVVQDPHATTAAFAHNTVILGQSHNQQQQGAARGRSSNGSQASAEESEASLLALGSGDEYETPLGPPGVSYSDQSSSPRHFYAGDQRQEQGNESDVDESGMDMDVSGDGEGMLVSDGLTSRRISVGGTLRRGSVAPGQAALAMLDGVDEDDEGDTEEYDTTASITPQQSEEQQQQQDVTFKQNDVQSARPNAPLAASQPPPRSPGRAPRSPARSPGRAFRPTFKTGPGANAPRASIATSTTRIPHPPSFLPKAAPRQSEPLRPQATSRPSSVSFAPPTIAPSPEPLKPSSQQQKQQSQEPEPPRESSSPSPEANESEEQHDLQLQTIESSEDELELADQDQAQQAENAMGLEDFFQLCGVKFMDDVFAGGKPHSRKSLVSQDQGHQPKGRASLADQIFAMSCSSHDLGTFSTMSKELRKAMEENGEWLDDMDSMVQDDMPEIFRRYMASTDEEKAAMDTAFKTAKSFYRTEVRNEWYAYKQTAMQDSCAAFDVHQEALNQDLAVVQATNAELVSITPELEARQRELDQQLERERAREAEIAQCDAEELAGLREAVAEQETQVNDFVREQADVDAQLERVKARIAEMATEKNEHQQAISEAQRMREAAGFTSGEQVIHLKTRLATLESLHGWKIVEFNASELKLLYLDEICVVLRLTASGVGAVRLSMPQRVEDKKDAVAGIKRFLFEQLKAFIERPGEPHLASAPALLQKVSSIWTAAERVLHEVHLVRRRYPVTAHLMEKKKDGSTSPFCRISVRVHCQRSQASFVVLLDLKGDEILQASPSDLQSVISELTCRVEPKYGKPQDLDCKDLQYTVSEHASEGHSGALLAGCEAAEAKQESKTLTLL